jgi:hypothetical protein
VAVLGSVTFSGTVYLTSMTPKAMRVVRLGQAKGNSNPRIGSKQRRRCSNREIPDAKTPVFVEEHEETTAAARAAEGILIERVLAGEREPFCELVKGYERPLYATALAILKNEADASQKWSKKRS